MDISALRLRIICYSSESSKISLTLALNNNFFNNLHFVSSIFIISACLFSFSLNFLFNNSFFYSVFFLKIPFVSSAKGFQLLSLQISHASHHDQYLFVLFVLEILTTVVQYLIFSVLNSTLFHARTNSCIFIHQWRGTRT